MAELIYDKDGRLLFTEEMKEEYTILAPNMLPIHMSFLIAIMRSQGFKGELLTSTNPEIVNQGLQSVHNDTCYPALLVIGQMMEALESGKYDLNKVALIITQTGGGCRASNYIHLLRRALKRRGLEQIPVISFNLQGMEKNPGFTFPPKVWLKLLATIAYGDLLMNLSNQCRPYEINAGETDRLTDYWHDELLKRGMPLHNLSSTLDEICASYTAIPRDTSLKAVKVGVVGEIYIKYAPLGNNNLEAFLAKEGCEAVVPGLLDFVIFMGDHHLVDTRRYHIKHRKALASLGVKGVFSWFQNKLRSAIAKTEFRVPADFATIKALAAPFVSDGNKMGEGWLLTGEMLELIHSGVTNIVCTQPFGCLPNHISGKGMIRAIRNAHPEANIVAIDYDPGATRANQENRLRLMLASARETLYRA
ncbi:MAG: 2-hydroxyacyl-CoA dehydratase [Oscillospiraceae bacterium]|jgi:predicted nucleotide-binding protein (sugar kinase/HSP70/actin superfamily)|nr:2-hydroxyacyl-CoA dehydratase [Oscillospiraceae bacterium]